MPRSSWTSSEDEIVLTTAGVPHEQVNALLVERVHGPREAKEIVNRRQYLRRRGEEPQSMTHDALSRAASELSLLRVHVDRKKREYEDIKKQYEAKREEVQYLLDSDVL